MDRLTAVSAITEWAARLAGPLILWGCGVAGLVIAIVLAFDSHWSLACVAGVAGTGTTVTALHAMVRAVQRLRTGPKAPPGEGL